MEKFKFIADTTSNLKNSNMSLNNSFWRSEVAISQEVQTSSLYRVYIDENISDDTSYRSLITLLGSADENDTVVFHIACDGGLLDKALQICTAIQNCQAHTVAQLDSHAASAATLFVLACDQVLVSEHAFMMLHSGSFGYFGKQQELKTHVDFQFERLAKITYEVYKGFLSKDEITDMVYHQKDYYFTAEEVINRLQARDAELSKEPLEDPVVPGEDIQAVPTRKRKTVKKGEDV